MSIAMQFREFEETVEGWESRHSNTRYGLEYEVRPQDDPRTEGKSVLMTRFFCCPEARRSAMRELEFRRQSVDATLAERERCLKIAHGTARIAERAIWIGPEENNKYGVTVAMSIARQIESGEK